MGPISYTLYAFYRQWTCTDVTKGIIWPKVTAFFLSVCFTDLRVYLQNLSLRLKKKNSMLVHFKICMLDMVHMESQCSFLHEKPTIFRKEYQMETSSNYLHYLSSQVLRNMPNKLSKLDYLMSQFMTYHHGNPKFVRS